jgi:hypothetical protein
MLQKIMKYFIILLGIILILATIFTTLALLEVNIVKNLPYISLALFVGGLMTYGIIRQAHSLCNAWVFFMTSFTMVCCFAVGVLVTTMDVSGDSVIFFVIVTVIVLMCFKQKRRHPTISAKRRIRR